MSVPKGPEVHQAHARMKALLDKMQDLQDEINQVWAIVEPWEQADAEIRECTGPEPSKKEIHSAAERVAGIIQGRVKITEPTIDQFCQAIGQLVPRIQFEYGWATANHPEEASISIRKVARFWTNAAKLAERYDGLSGPERRMLADRIFPFPGWPDLVNMHDERTYQTRFLEHIERFLSPFRFKLDDKRPRGHDRFVRARQGIVTLSIEELKHQFDEDVIRLWALGFREKLKIPATTTKGGVFMETVERFLNLIEPGRGTNVEKKVLSALRTEHRQALLTGFNLDS